MRLSELRQAYRILDEVSELANDIHAWRAHLIGELLKLVHLQMATTFVMPLPLDTANANVSRIAMAGLDETGNRIWLEYGQRGDLTRDPCSPAIVARRRPFASARQMLASDQDWYRSAYYNEFRRLTRSDDLLVSLVKLPAVDYVHGISGDRAKGDRPIGRREILITSLIQQELLRKWERKALASEAGPWQLSPRLQQLLEHLRGPFSEKEIARQMELSPYTVHNHIRRLYSKFDVSSRAELIMLDRKRQINHVPHLGIGPL